MILKGKDFNGSQPPFIMTEIIPHIHFSLLNTHRFYCVYSITEFANCGAMDFYFSKKMHKCI